MKLKNKIALITGGSLGIGKSTAILFAKEGAKVLITGRTEKSLKQAVEEAGKEGLKIDYLVSDVAKEEDCKAAMDYTINKHGRIDILFNNAGVLPLGVTHETSTEDWDNVFNINVRGTYLMSKYAIPHMLKQGKGCIVNNSSVLGLKAIPGAAAVQGRERFSLRHHLEPVRYGMGGGRVFYYRRVGQAQAPGNARLFQKLRRVFDEQCPGGLPR